MNWKQRLFKPKWQHKDADIRLAAVSSENDPQLINKLVEIAGQDTDSRVRCAAIKRLHKLENIMKLYASENQAEVKSLLEDRIRQLASSSAPDRPPLELRMQVAESTTDRNLIEHLAGHAPEASLRRAALARVKRQGVLGDCCLNDDDAENRQFAAERITQHTTLKRVINGLRKRDKTLYQQLQNRLHEELLASADPAAVQTEALKICNSLEHHAIEIATADDGTIPDLHKAWQKIAASVKPEISERYQRVCQRLSAPGETATPAPAPTKVAAPDPTPTITPLPVSASESVAPEQANEDLAQAATDICLYDVENPDQPKVASIKTLKRKLEMAWKQCRPPHPEDQANWDEAWVAIEHMESTLDQLRKKSEKQLAQAESLLSQLAQELEDGELHKALETRANLQKLNKEKSAGNHGAWKRINGKLSGMQPRLRELREWQHWSNNKIRKRLIAEMEVLPAADLHPDALLDRIKSLQTEWKTLEQSEQIPGEKHFSAAPWMWRKFSAAGHAAFDTAKPFLDKRSEIQSRHAQSLATFCAELEQLAEAEPRDWIALGKAMNRGRKKLRDLNSIPAKQRQSFARKLKSALDKANRVMQDHYEVVEKEKMKLIRAASQLIHLPERSEAIAEAKGLQSQWKAAGSLWRSKEQQLWNQFREHLDPLFEELKEQQASIRVADEERLAAQKALCNELKEILSNKDDLAAHHGRVQGLRDSWKDIQHPDRKLLASFQAMVAEYDQMEVDAQKQQVKADRERWWLKFSLLHELAVSGRTKKGAISKKTEARVNKTWPAESSSDPLETKLDQACQGYLSGDLAVADDARQEDLREQAHMLCIRLEFVAGLQSPEEDKEKRMQYQVDRLAESLSGESVRLPALEEGREAEKIWLQMYGLPETEFKAFGKRIQKALSAITES